MVGHIANERWDYRKQLSDLMMSLNVKEQQRKGNTPKVLWGKCPQHFVDRLFERVDRVEINDVVSTVLHHIHDNKGIIRSECITTTTTTVTYGIHIAAKYTAYVELELKTINLLCPIIIVTPKTIIDRLKEEN